jgi:transposase
MPSRASCTEGGPWERIAKSLWLSTSPRRSTPLRSRKGAGREKSGFSDVENSPLPIERTIKRLAGRYDRLHVCFEAGPTGYGLYRQIQALDHDCTVVAPALIPKRSGERIKTDRRDAVTLARLRAANWREFGCPTPLTRRCAILCGPARRRRTTFVASASNCFDSCWRHSRIYIGGGHWTMTHRPTRISSMPRSRSSFRKPSALSPPN